MCNYILISAFWGQKLWSHLPFGILIKAKFSFFQIVENLPELSRSLKNLELFFDFPGVPAIIFSYSSWEIRTGFVCTEKKGMIILFLAQSNWLHCIITDMQYAYESVVRTAGWKAMAMQLETTRINASLESSISQFQTLTPAKLMQKHDSKFQLFWELRSKVSNYVLPSMDQKPLTYGYIWYVHNTLDSR